MKNAIRTGAVVAVVVAVAFGYVQLAQNKGYALKKGGAAPAFSLPALDGQAVDLASFGGKVVVLNFWATWCPPCVAEMPSLQRLERALSPEGLAVVTVSTDEDEAALRRFVKEHGLTLPVLRDPGGRVAAREYRTTGYPETFVLDRTGVLLQHTVGPAEWDSPQSIDYFRGLLRGAPAAAP
jgi:peroxiredoxin